MRFFPELKILLPAVFLPRQPFVIQPGQLIGHGQLGQALFLLQISDPIGQGQRQKDRFDCSAQSQRAAGDHPVIVEQLIRRPKK